jgi:hypothetical protein
MPAEPTKIVKLYGGEVTVKFFDKPYHKFLVTDPVAGIVDKRLRGVTTYLGIKDKSTGLVPWATRAAGLYLVDKIRAGQQITEEDVIHAVNLHRALKDEAAETGKVTHAWCQSFIEYKLGRSEVKPVLPESKPVLLGVNSFLEFVIQHNVEFVDTELIVYHREEQYIGFMDALATVNGALSVIDLKTSNGLYNTALAQMSAYAKAYEREHRDSTPYVSQVENRWALRLAKESEAEYVARKERECFIDGKSVNTIKQYLPFEFVECPGRETLERDFDAFIWMRNTFGWDEATDFYKHPLNGLNGAIAIAGEEVADDVVGSLKTKLPETQKQKLARYDRMIAEAKTPEDMVSVEGIITLDTDLSASTLGVMQGKIRARLESI